MKTSNSRNAEQSKIFIQAAMAKMEYKYLYLEPVTEIQKQIQACTNEDTLMA